MTDDTIHTCSYSCERPGCIRAQRDELAARLTAETSNARGKVEYEYEVWQGDALQAGGRENDYASAQSEASHYAMMYAQDGPVEVRIYEKRLLSADKIERDWLADAMDEMAERRMDALEAGSEDGLQAEVEALRAEVAEWKRVAAAQAELHGEAEDRAEQLAEALRELVEVFSESGMYDEEVFDKARAVLAKENSND